MRLVYETKRCRRFWRRSPPRRATNSATKLPRNGSPAQHPDQVAQNDRHPRATNLRRGVLGSAGTHGARRGLTGFTNYDDGVNFGGALGLVHGELPYRDFLWLHPPGIELQ
jgi:hypothetical protein